MLEDRYYTHILACSHAASHRTIYSLLSRHTHTHIHTERGESSKLRCGFVPLMNLQRDSIESPFTYMYVINTTYYYWGAGMSRVVLAGSVWVFGVYDLDG